MEDETQSDHHPHPGSWTGTLHGDTDLLWFTASRKWCHNYNMSNRNKQKQLPCQCPNSITTQLANSTRCDSMDNRRNHGLRRLDQQFVLPSIESIRRWRRLRRRIKRTEKCVPGWIRSSGSLLRRISGHRQEQIGRMFGLLVRHQRGFLVRRSDGSVRMSSLFIRPVHERLQPQSQRQSSFLQHRIVPSRRFVDNQFANQLDDDVARFDLSSAVGTREQNHRLSENRYRKHWMECLAANTVIRNDGSSQATRRRSSSHHRRCQPIERHSRTNSGHQIVGGLRNGPIRFEIQSVVVSVANYRLLWLDWQYCLRNRLVQFETVSSFIIALERINN